MSINELLFHLASTIKIQQRMLVFSPWNNWKIAELAIKNNHALIHISLTFHLSLKFIMAKWKETKRWTVIYKIFQRKLKIKQHGSPLQTGCELRFSGLASSSCSTCGTHRVCESSTLFLY
jgi:hypothetical protein